MGTDESSIFSTQVDLSLSFTWTTIYNIDGPIELDVICILFELTAHIGAPTTSHQASRRLRHPISTLPLGLSKMYKRNSKPERQKLERKR